VQESLSETLVQVEEVLSNDLERKIAEYSNRIAIDSDALACVNSFLDILNKLIEVNEWLSQATNYLHSEQFSMCSKSCCDLKKRLHELEKFKGLKLYQNITRKINSLEDTFNDNVLYAWGECIEFREASENPEYRSIVLKIYCKRRKQLEELIRALVSSTNNTILNDFFQKLKNSVLLPIIIHHTIISVHDSDDVISLTAKISETDVAQSYVVVLDRILTVIEFVDNNLSVTSDHENITRLMGETIADDLISLLIKHVLTEAIPTDSDYLAGFSDIVNEAGKFQDKLQRMGFLHSNFVSQLSVENGNTFFAHKLYQSCLEQGRSIARRELYPFIKASPINIHNLFSFPLNVRIAIKEQFHISKEGNFFDKLSIR